MAQLKIIKVIQNVTTGMVNANVAVWQPGNIYKSKSFITSNINS